MRKSILFPTFLGKEAIYDGPTSLTFVFANLSKIYSHHTYAEAFMIIDGGCLSDLLRICTLKRDAKSKILRSNLGKKSCFAIETFIVLCPFQGDSIINNCIEILIISDTNEMSKSTILFEKGNMARHAINSSGEITICCSAKQQK